MGYILPITHFQYMQYNNRVVSYLTAQQNHQSVSASPTIFPAILHAKSQELLFTPNQQNVSAQNMISIQHKKIGQVSHITGKGGLFDAYV